MITVALPETRSDDAALVSKAAARAADRLGISDQTLASIIGVSEEAVRRMRAGEFALEQDRNAFERSLLFVQLYRSLDAVVSGDQAAAASWLLSHNTALDARPIDAVRSISGLVSIIDYLDSRRDPL